MEFVSYLNWILEPKTRFCFISKKPLWLEAQKVCSCRIVQQIDYNASWPGNQQKWEGSRRLNILHESHELSKHNIGRECNSELQSDLLEDIQKIALSSFKLSSVYHNPFSTSHLKRPIKKGTIYLVQQVSINVREYLIGNSLLVLLPVGIVSANNTICQYVFHTWIFELASIFFGDDISWCSTGHLHGAWTFTLVGISCHPVQLGQPAEVSNRIHKSRVKPVSPTATSHLVFSALELSWALNDQLPLTKTSKKVEYHAKRDTGKFCSWAVRYMSEQSWNTPQEGCCNLWCIVKMSCKSPPAIAATSTNQKGKCTPTRPNRDFVRQKEYHLRLPCQSSWVFHLDSSL